MCAQLLSHVLLFLSPWAVACQAPLSLKFSRKGYWSGLRFPSPGHLPDPGIDPGIDPHLSFLLHWQRNSLLLYHLGSPLIVMYNLIRSFNIFLFTSWSINILICKISLMIVPIVRIAQMLKLMLRQYYVKHLAKYLTQSKIFNPSYIDRCSEVMHIFYVYLYTQYSRKSLRAKKFHPFYQFKLKTWNVYSILIL